MKSKTFLFSCLTIVTSIFFSGFSCGIVFGFLVGMWGNKDRRVGRILRLALIASIIALVMEGALQHSLVRAIGAFVVSLVFFPVGSLFGSKFRQDSELIDPGDGMHLLDDNRALYRQLRNQR